MSTFVFSIPDRAKAYIYVKQRLDDNGKQMMYCIDYLLWEWAAYHWEVRELPFDHKFIYQLFPEFARFEKYKPSDLTFPKRILIINNMLDEIETQMLLG